MRASLVEKNAIPVAITAMASTGHIGHAARMIPHGPGTDRTADFHAHHAPVGALASFTCGRFHADSGFGAELGKAVPGGAVFAGYREAGGPLRLLPFAPMTPDEAARYLGTATSDAPRRPFVAAEIRREIGWCTDRWLAGDLVFEVLTPHDPLPDPATAPIAAQRDAYVPAVLVRLTIANPGPHERTLYLAQQLPDRWLPLTGVHGLGCRRGVGLATDTPEAQAFCALGLDRELEGFGAARVQGLGNVAGFSLRVPPGATRTLTVAIGVYLPQVVTLGRSMRYWYTRLFGSLDDVLAHALARAEVVRARCAARDAELAAAPLHAEQRFLVAHATRGYHASTQLLDDGGRPRWVVHEGEYLMHNTFDLTADMVFHELRFSPWAVANVLDQYAAEYRYDSRVYHPMDPTRLMPGGVAFTHDMGVMNVWSPVGRSSYEVDGLDRVCFSHMSCEELANWVCCAGVYLAATRDAAFLARHRSLLLACQASLANRDHPEPSQRRGWMQCEDERCRGTSHSGGEITTYDSLDHSLGQSRANGYLAMKMWAAHVLLADALGEAGAPARAEAQRIAAAVIASADPVTGIMPALLDGTPSAPIIPVIEALIFPHRAGHDLSDTGPWGELVRALRRHLRAVLVPGVCLYPDGGWKLSASADNSWASKIHLCQYVAEVVLGVASDPRSHRAHADWQRHGAADHGVSDQFHSGVAKGSLSYPRIVTTTLWVG
jgi:hypothetical protein